MPPYDAGSALRALAAHDVPGMQRTNVDARTHARAVRSPTGVPTGLEVRFEADHVRLEAWSCVTSGERLAEGQAAGLAWLEPAVRRWLDLDAEPERILEVLASDPVIGGLVRRRPGLRVMASIDPFEAVVGSVVGQQVSVTAGRTFAGRLVAAYGSSPDAAGLSAFPLPAELAVVAPDELQARVGLTGRRARTVLALARLFADGFRLDGLTVEATREALGKVPGVGPWTLDQIGLRVLADRDALPAGDLVLRRALGGRDEREVVSLAEAWRPYRAYATVHLWSEALYG